MKTKQQKREEADVRQKAYDALSTAEKLNAIHRRRGDSAREVARLTKGD